LPKENESRGDEEIRNKLLPKENESRGDEEGGNTLMAEKMKAGAMKK
jgi:hypothetical protein